jgi:hypothetical protein
MLRIEAHRFEKEMNVVVRYITAHLQSTTIDWMKQIHYTIHPVVFKLGTQYKWVNIKQSLHPA